MEDEKKDKGLIVREFLPPEEIMAQIKSTCTVMVQSGILPDGITTVEQAMVVAMTGWELGLPLMMSFRLLYPVKGRVGMMGEAKLALIKQRCKSAEIETVTETADKVEMKARRSSDAPWQTFHMTFSEAHEYGYDVSFDKSGTPKAKFPWKNRRRMLKWRVVGEIGSFMFPDIVGGLEDPDQLNDYQVEVSTETEVHAATRGSVIPKTTDAPPIDVPEIPANPGKAVEDLELMAPAENKEADDVAAQFLELLTGLKPDERENLYNEYRDKYRGQSEFLLAIREAYTKK